MVVSSDKVDYGSFAEPTSSGFDGSSLRSHQNNNIDGVGVNNRSRANSVYNSNSNTSSSTTSLRSTTAKGGSKVINSNSGSGNTSVNVAGGCEKRHSYSSISIQSNPTNFVTSAGIGFDRNLSLSKSVESQGAIITAVGGSRDSCSCRSYIVTENFIGNSSTGGAGISTPTAASTVVVLNNNNNVTVTPGTSAQVYSQLPSPMSTTSGDLLYQRQPLLQNCENGWNNSSDGDVPLEVATEAQMGIDGKRPRGGNNVGGAIRVDMPLDAEPINNGIFPKEKKKTFIAFVILTVNFVLATVSLALTHQRLPDRSVYKPLPDIVLDNVATQDWALYVSEVLIMVSVAVTVTVLFLHKHRWIVFRRAFLILAALYLMRSVTMFVTVLPVSSYTYYCSPPSNSSTSVFEIARRALRLLSGFGLSINGEQVYCGDYIYSGHTVILVTAYLFINEYSSPKFWLLHYASFLASLTGVIMVLISRGHYTIDVLVAYYVTTRLFWIYHTLANNAALKRTQPQFLKTNYISRIWWYPVFVFMEGNVGGTLPKKYSFPWSSKLNRTRRSI